MPNAALLSMPIFCAQLSLIVWSLTISLETAPLDELGHNAQVRWPHACPCVGMAWSLGVAPLKSIYMYLFSSVSGLD
jgi:hypothetical protein